MHELWYVFLSLGLNGRLQALLDSEAEEVDRNTQQVIGFMGEVIFYFMLLGFGVGENMHLENEHARVETRVSKTIPCRCRVLLGRACWCVSRTRACVSKCVLRTLAYWNLCASPGK